MPLRYHKFHLLQIFMNKVPFTPAGFKQLEAWLYALNNTELRLEADAVNADYIDWVTNHVTLNDDQVDFLNGLDALFIAALGSKAAIAFVNRLPLNLELPDNYALLTAEKKTGKWFLDKSSIMASNTPNGALLATGELTYEMQFE